MEKVEYITKLRAIWVKFGSKSGQCDYVQGELLRAIEKIKYEIEEHGNANYSAECHGVLLQFLKDTLNDTAVFDTAVIEELNANLKKLEKQEEEEMSFGDDFSFENMSFVKVDEALFDKIYLRIAQWCLHYPEGVLHKKNDLLKC